VYLITDGDRTDFKQKIKTISMLE